MPCEWYEKDGVVIHINRGRSQGPRRTCKFCHQEYYGGKLCDYPIAPDRTCDAEMCNECARTIGRQASDTGGGLKRLNDTIDVCPIHRDRAIATGGQIQIVEKSAGVSAGDQSKLTFDSSCSTTRKDNP